jgi:hypothetical protein
MRTILAACVALGTAGFALASPAHADVTITTPGVAVEGGPYWRHHHPDAEWRERREFHEAQEQRAEWLRDHCVRDWSGGEYCRR